MTATWNPYLTIRAPMGGKIEWEIRPGPIVKNIPPGGSEWFKGKFDLPKEYWGKKVYLMDEDDCGVRRFSPSGCSVSGEVRHGAEK